MATSKDTAPEALPLAAIDDVEHPKEGLAELGGFDPTTKPKFERADRPTIHVRDLMTGLNMAANAHPNLSMLLLTAKRALMQMEDQLREVRLVVGLQLDKRQYRGIDVTELEERVKHYTTPWAVDLIDGSTCAPVAPKESAHR
jgi:hypothetical protein